MLNFTVTQSDIAVFLSGDTKTFNIAFNNVETLKTYTFDYSLVDYWGNVITGETGLSTSISGNDAIATISPSITTLGWYKVLLTLYKNGVEIPIKNTNIANVNNDNNWFSFAILSSPPIQTSTSPFGINEHTITNNSMLACQKAGIQWVRHQKDSYLINSAPDTFDWSVLDAEVAIIDSHDLNWLPLIAYGIKGVMSTVYPGITSDTNRYLPVIDPYWETFLDAYIDRYDGYTNFWEVWNEPNLDSYWKDTDENFVVLNDYCYDEIKALQETAVIVQGGISGNGSTWVPWWNETTGYNHMDKYNIHPYDFTKPNNPESSLIVTFNHERISTKPRWCTEIGWSTYTYMNSLQEQAQYIPRTMLIALYSGLEKLFFYQLINTGITDSAKSSVYDRERNFGLLYYDLSPKPSYVSYANLIKQLAGYTYDSLSQPTATSYVLKFTNGGDVVKVAWTTETSETVDIVINDTPVEVMETNTMGVSTNIGNQTTYSKMLTGDPIYLKYTL